MKAQDIMTKDVLSVDQSTYVKEAVSIMAENDIEALIVQIEGPNFGIFTQRDLLTRVVAKGKDIGSTKIKDVMTQSIKCAQVEDSVDDVLKVMYEENIRYLPVMEKRRLVGIISIADLFKVTFRASEGYTEEVL
ncbi:MAG: CBS domain-containing protein [Thermodesulfobacteriota bacterium]|jgi:CBS domain-containing protein